MADLAEYWADHPPLQWMVQGYLGIKPKPPEMNPDDFRALVQSLQPPA